MTESPAQETVELSLTKALVEEAEELGLDVEVICRQGIQDAVEAAKKTATKDD